LLFPRPENLGGLKSIGKAGKAVTKQLGKTLTSMGESPDKRGHDKVFLTQHPNLLPMPRKKRPDRLRTEGKTDLGMESGKSLDSQNLCNAMRLVTSLKSICLF
jgi:hypothetical protein